MSRLTYSLVALTLAVFLASPLCAYQLALKDGRVIQFQKYRMADKQFFYVAEDGKEVVVQLADVDLERTRQLNAAQSPPLQMPGLNSPTAPNNNLSAQPSLGEVARKYRQLKAENKIVVPAAKPGEQSLAAHAAKVREQQAKDGKDHTWWRNVGPSTASGQAPAVASTQGVSRGTLADQMRPEIRQLQDQVDDLSSKTERQLANVIVGDVNFPGRSYWEAKLAAERDRMVAALRESIDAMEKYADAVESGDAGRIAGESSILQEKTANLRLEKWRYQQLVAEGQKAATEWERNH